MHLKSQSLFYILSGFLLMAVFFVLQPSQVSEVTVLQTQMKGQFSLAWQQTIGDGTYLDSTAFVLDAVSAFFDQSSEALIALLTQPETDQTLYYVYHTVYMDFAQVLNSRSFKLSENNISLPPADSFMTQQAVKNILPDSMAATKALSGSVLGAITSASAVEPANKINSWITIQDNFTGQIYCLAIYNGEVNKYLGACKNDYH